MLLLIIFLYTAVTNYNDNRLTDSEQNPSKYDVQIPAEPD